MFLLKNLDEIVNNLRQKRTVIAPRKWGDVVVYGEIEKAEEWVRVGLPIRPLKEWFFPATEHLFYFRDGQIREPDLEDKPFVIWGARMCDVASLQMQDKVFNGVYIDPYYIHRRKLATIVLLRCKEPLWGCFCKEMGIGEEGADLILTPLEDGFALEVASPKGEELLKDFGVQLEEAGDRVIEEVREVLKHFEESFSAPYDKEIVHQFLKGAWEHPIWSELARRCLSCGICTFLCPTCHCFDIEDENITLQVGARYRCWDTCQFAIFTLQTSGHNPRPTKRERVRQRFMHKLFYCPERYSETFCTGCGRCVRLCPVNIDIREVLKLASFQEVSQPG
ncbi:4Fe-4S dicluster domain-containing protein [bacterium]|nr:4Fe-4S dicluster domain-containing protein [bacterium]